MDKEKMSEIKCYLLEVTKIKKGYVFYKSGLYLHIKNSPPQMTSATQRNLGET